MTLKPPLIIIESDSCSGNGITDSAITISDASLGNLVFSHFILFPKWIFLICR